MEFKLTNVHGFANCLNSVFVFAIEIVLLVKFKEVVEVLLVNYLLFILIYYIKYESINHSHLIQFLQITIFKKTLIEIHHVVVIYIKLNKSVYISTCLLIEVVKQKRPQIHIGESVAKYYYKDIHQVKVRIENHDFKLEVLIRLG